ncbi:hypothetical protein AAUI01_08230 [Pseudomonas mosselii]|uniref:hypothetical protein n=1 Tax=Pseudomonas mosselii TaxID=78327 RepID=UPI0032E43A0F
MKHQHAPHPAAYYLGRACRDNGQSKHSQPYGWMTADCGWWLAGWNDRDLELIA